MSIKVGHLTTTTPLARELSLHNVRAVITFPRLNPAMLSELIVHGARLPPVPISRWVAAMDWLDDWDDDTQESIVMDAVRFQDMYNKEGGLINVTYSCNLGRFFLAYKTVTIV